MAVGDMVEVAGTGVQRRIKSMQAFHKPVAAANVVWEPNKQLMCALVFINRW